MGTLTHFRFSEAPPSRLLFQRATCMVKVGSHLVQDGFDQFEMPRVSQLGSDNELSRYLSEDVG